jgi:hypothetical protein
VGYQLGKHPVRHRQLAALVLLPFYIDAKEKNFLEIKLINLIKIIIILHKQLFLIKMK